MIVALLVGAGVVRQLKAYVFIGPYWSGTQIQYYVNPTNLYVSDTAVVTALKQAASAWSTQANPNMKLVYAGSTTDASLSLNYMNEVFFRNDSNGYYAAETYWWGNCCGQIIDSDTVFHEANYVFFTGTSGCTGAGEYIEDVATHEFGHMQGLAHSTVATATMYPTNTYCDQSWRTLDQDDIAGIQALYPPAATTSQPPTAPSSLIAQPNPANPSSSAQLAWSESAANAAGYSVGRSSDGATFTQVAQLGGSTTTYTDTGLAAGAMYFYRVAAYNSAGSSGFSNVASTQTQPVTQSAPPAPPAVPSGGSPNGSTSVSGNVTLSWTATPGAQTYDVYFGTSVTPSLYASKLKSTSERAGSLRAGTKYYWMVIAKNTTGSTASPLWQFTTKASGSKK
ncbi:MAG TPA: matrixin family metalloprotease [Vicinamibacterales bacterium]|nr:matrixin family metalloprotease [Vicinamibacterales bacterium]